MATPTLTDRICAIWEAPTTIDTVCDAMRQKLQCPNCEVLFNGEDDFGVHINHCFDLSAHETNTKFLMHKHANRLLVFQNRVALFCGVSNQGPILKCDFCNAQFEDRESIRRHIRRCARYSDDYKRFIRDTSQMFDSLFHSHQQLGLIIRRSNEQIHKKLLNRQKRRFCVSSRLITRGSRRHIFFDHIDQNFVENYQPYLFEVCNLVDDLFLCFLRNHGDLSKIRIPKTLCTHNVFDTPEPQAAVPRIARRSGTRNRRAPQCPCGC